MDIDIYQTCPCHSEKKIKFCCGKDIVADLDKILSLTKSKQLTAALENLDRTIDRLGARDCLLTLKTHILINLHEYDQAREVNEQFLAANPNYAVGHQHRAILLATESDSAGAVDALQDALDASPKDEVPVSMCSAFRTVGMLLMTQGDVVASRAHLMFAGRIGGEDNEVANRLILQTFRAPDIPIQLKHDWTPQVNPSDDPWYPLLANAGRFAVRARWREALRRAVTLEHEYPDVHEITKCVAAWSLYLGYNRQAAEAFGRLVKNESLSFASRIDAESVRLLLDEQPLTEKLDMVRVVYKVDDWPALVEQATANPRLIAGTIIGEQFAGEGPPPAAAFVLLDRDEVTSAASASFDQIPSVLAETLVYGKQTDRPARIELIVARGDAFEHIKHELQRALGPQLGKFESEEVIDQISLLDHKLSFQWHLPRDMSPEDRKRFVAEQRRNEIMEIWTSIPFISLDGLSAEQAKDDEEKQFTLSALVSIMEQGSESQLDSGFDFDALREKLGLPAAESIDPIDLDIYNLSPVQMQLLDVEKLDDEPLMHAYVTASTIGNIRALRKCCEVILRRPQLEKYVPFESVFMTLAKLTVETERALELMQSARHHASSSGRPVGHLLVDELEIRLERGLIASCSDLLRTIQSKHAADPEVQYHLAAVLQRFGIMDSEGRMAVPDAPESVAPVETTQPSAIWTPEGEAEASPAPASTGQKSKLWLPE